MRDKTDIELIELIAQDNQRAFNEFYRRYNDLIISYIVLHFHYIREREELIGNIWVRIHRAFKRRMYKHTLSKPNTYLCNIAHNEAVNEIRRHHQHQMEIQRNSLTFDDEGWRAIGNGVTEPVDELKAERLELIQIAIPLMPPVLQEAITYRLNGYKYNEIAKLTKTNINTVKTNVFRAKREIKKLLAHAA